ncbi:sulfoxide reductase heme-binding subunit YedZ [Alteromonas sp. ASW11-19]|uniref:Protein-methionine-sulfoxide reductase heme-binding subunit MsrQ n=1 Tax=Alteromonas salexigens TaxID=2982530 RepID=A0ABT2VL00_9ALTE|nr:protein-methionine-sulfoxide reductase heme-binding subunit MsrQ [Alteromonas salexigens]MCU7553975.1 sulfoxide reductase heme-binding subunit YedZ [Alteromonas salexigens]
MNRLLSRPLRLPATPRRLTKAGIHLLATGYLVALFYWGATDNLGADPVKALLHSTGTWAINLLLISLSISPLAKWLPFPDLMRFRRLVGLYSFTYAMVHFFSFCAFELQFDWTLIASEIVERPYITVGFAALLILSLLAATSTTPIQRRMGPAWQRLHNWVYAAALLALLHYTWSLKTVWEEPVFYWLIAAGLLYLRRDKLLWVVRKKFKKNLAR